MKRCYRFPQGSKLGDFVADSSILSFQSLIVPGTVPSALHEQLTAVTLNGYYCHLHFTNKEMEALTISMICLIHTLRNSFRVLRAKS